MKKIRRSSHNTSIAICSDCGGNGKHFIPGTKIAHNRYEDDKEEVCETCEGEGVVCIEKHIHSVTTITPRSHE